VRIVEWLTAVYEVPTPTYGAAGGHLVADEDGVLALEDVERLVLAVMDVKRGSGATRTRHFDRTDYAVRIVG
jgi:hypothetical protein